MSSIVCDPWIFVRPARVLLGWAMEEYFSSVHGNLGNAPTITAACQCFWSDIGEFKFSVPGGWQLYVCRTVGLDVVLTPASKKSLGINDQDEITHTADDKRGEQELIRARLSLLIKTGSESHNSPLNCALQPPLIPLLTSRGPRSWRLERAAIFHFAQHKLGI